MRSPISCAVSLIFLAAFAMGSEIRETSQAGIIFLSPVSVSSEAIVQAQRVVTAMLSQAPRVKEKMIASHFKIEIIAKDQVISDLPDYHQLRNQRTFDGRDYDSGTRGVGEKEKCSVGEENLLCAVKQKYGAEDILVHEFAHSINANMNQEEKEEIESAYENAKTKQLYPVNSYIATNAQEYWAEGTQAWLGVTLRTDMNGGFNSAEKLRAHDPRLAFILNKFYGDKPLNHLDGCAY